MIAHAFRHFYDYHFAENRKILDSCITQLRTTFSTSTSTRRSFAASALTLPIS